MFLYLGFWYIFIYNVMALFYSYRAYNHFKYLFQAQYADGYSAIDNERNPLDDYQRAQQEEEDRRYQEQQRQLREQFRQR